MNDKEVILLIILFVAFVLGICQWYASRWGVPLKEVLLLLWQEIVVGGFRDLKKSFIPATKMVGAMLWDYAKCWAAVLGEFFKTAPAPAKHIFTQDLRYALLEVVKDYAYAPFQPTIEQIFTAVPSALYVAFYTKNALRAETVAEIVWHIKAKFEEYLACCGLQFAYTIVPYVQDNYIQLWLYYCENPTEYPAYRERCRQAMLMKADPVLQPLPESAILQIPGLVLGCRYDTWRSTGQAVPIIWDPATAPHILVSGPTGGGKTVFVKLLLERLMREGATVTVCDYKGYGDLKGFVKEYAAGKDCDAMLSAFCAAFERDRATGITHRRKKVLIFDEFGAFSSSKTKKEADELMRTISNLVFMSRQYNYHIILVAQRFDTETIKTSLREQFGIKVYMGSSISPQAAAMLFPDAEIDKSSRLAPYCGYISTPKMDLDIVLLPKMDVQALDKRLKSFGKKNKNPGAA